MVHVPIKKLQIILIFLCSLSRMYVTVTIILTPSCIIAVTNPYVISSTYNEGEGGSYNTQRCWRVHTRREACLRIAAISGLDLQTDDACMEVSENT